MTSWTWSGDFVAAHVHLPFAVSQQAVINRLGVQSRNLQINSSDWIMVQPHHIHINAGIIGYEFYANEGGYVQSGGTLGRFFLNGQEEDTPKLLNSSAPEYDVNTWYYDGGYVTGGLATRYHTLVTGLGGDKGVEPRVYQAFPKVYQGGQLLFQGDAGVMAAALLNGYLIGISYTGTLYAWDSTGTLLATSPLTPTWGSDNDVYGAHWVFNKDGTQCVGISYPTFDGFIAPGVGNVLNQKPYITIIDISESGGMFSANVIRDSLLSYHAIAADYDYTSDTNDLVIASIEMYDYETAMISNPSPPPTYFHAQDVDFVVKRDSDSVELIRETINYNNDWFDSDGFADPTKVSLDGFLVHLDLRYLSYAIVTYVHRPVGDTPNIELGWLKINSWGNEIYVDNSWVDYPAMSGAPNFTFGVKHFDFVKNFVDLRSHIHVHPKLIALACFYDENTNNSTDFMYSNGSFIQDYHLTAYGTVTASTNLKLAGGWI